MYYGKTYNLFRSGYETKIIELHQWFLTTIFGLFFIVVAVKNIRKL